MTVRGRTVDQTIEFYDDVTGDTLLTLDAGNLELLLGTGITFDASAGTLTPGLTSLSSALAGLTDGLGILRVCRATFDPSGDPTMRGIGSHLLGVAIPNLSIVVGGFVQVVTAMDSADHSGSLAVQINAANDVVNAAAINGAPWSTTGKKAIIPKANTPESTGVSLTADRQITAVVSTTALTVGKAVIWLYYVQGD